MAQQKVVNTIKKSNHKMVPDYLENNIIRFASLLRSVGLNIGSSEVIDALRGLQYIPLSDRKKVKGCLKATLIKKAADYQLFEDTFDLFFTSSEVRDSLRRLRQEKIEKRQERIKEAEKNLTFRGEKIHFSKSRRVLDLRSTIRSSIQYGGVPFQLKFKSRRVKKPRLLLLCDVSGSMIRYTSFVLQFVYGLNTVVQRIESFIFSENLERVTPHFQQGQDFEHTMDAVVRDSQEWGGGTSLHKALYTLFNRHGEELNRNTIVIIVSDTRTIRRQEAAEQLQKLRRQVKEIIWLNTLPRDEWSSYSTVAAFQKETSMFPCNTLEDLEQVMSRKLIPA